MAAVEKFKAPELNPADTGAHGTTVSVNVLKLLSFTPADFFFLFRYLLLYKKSLKRRRWMTLMWKRRI